MHKRTFVTLAIILTGASVFLFNFFYTEARNTAIAKLNEEQTIYAKQAARGIEDFFAARTQSLNSVSKMDAIIHNNAVGKSYLSLYYEANQGWIKSIVRLDERGVILYSFPSIRAAETDISDQKHVRELLRDQKPVISDVFRAVEGFDSVALHVPIFRGSEFKGSIGILIDFESLAKRYLDVIKIGQTGHAWVVSRDGTLLYSPVPGLTGKSVYEGIKDYPSLIVVVKDMLKGHEGTATYTYDRTSGRDVEQTRNYAVYMPVQLGNTFWSIAVASSEQDVLSGLIFFRNKLALVIGVLFICGMAFSTLGAKAWLIVKEEEKRKQAEKQLEERLSFEKLLTVISTQFINISIDRLDDGIKAAQRQICECLGLDVCGLWQFSPEYPSSLVMTHVYFPPDFPVKVPEMMDAKESFPWSLEMIMKKEPIVLSRIENSPPAASRDKESWKHFGLKSVLTYPLYAGDGVVFGALNFNTLKAEHDWPEELVNSLQIVAQVFASALNRKFIERTLRENEARLSDITFSMADWVWEVDENGIYTYSSAKGSEILGRSGEEIIGKTPFDFMPPDEAKRVAAIFSEISANKAPIKDLENWNIRKDGERICLLTNGVPILDKEGNLKGYRGVDKDITERKRAEEALKENEAALRYIQKDLQRLAGRLIFAQEEELRRLSRELHDDLTQRLAVIAIEAGKLELELSKMPKPCRKTLQTISGMKDQLIRVSEDVHNISRQIHPTILDDLGLVRAVESECATFMTRENIEIVFSKEDVPAAIDNNIGLCLYRVIQESLNNVIAHSRAKSCKIFLKGADDTIFLSVTDDGVGFDPVEVRHKAGLGLSSMRERVLLVQGDFSIKSQAGKGTVINVRVPLKGSGA